MITKLNRPIIAGAILAVLGSVLVLFYQSSHDDFASNDEMEMTAFALIKKNCQIHTVESDGDKYVDDVSGLVFVLDDDLLVCEMGGFDDVGKEINIWEVSKFMSDTPTIPMASVLVDSDLLDYLPSAQTLSQKEGEVAGYKVVLEERKPAGCESETCPTTIFATLTHREHNIQIEVSKENQEILNNFSFVSE